MASRRTSVLVLVLTLVTIVGWERQATTSHIEPQQPSDFPPLHPKTPARVQATYGNIPLHFEANQGQADAQVKFLARGSGYTLFLTAHEAVLALGKGTGNGERGTEKDAQSRSPIPDPRSPAAVRMQLVGANPQPRISGVDELPGKTNYFVGKDPTQWRTNIPTYAKVKYEQVYPGIDLVYYGNQQQVEYDFIVAPGADPKAIRLSFDGVGAVREPPLRIDSTGDLVLQTANGDIRFYRPHIYQEINGVKQQIDGRYVLSDSEYPDPRRETLDARRPQVGFEVAAYDTTKPLIIDPILSHVTVLKPTLFSNIALDAERNIYMTGGAHLSEDFPVTSGAVQSGASQNAIVIKLSPTGSLLYSAYFGGSHVDEGQDIAVDVTGNIYVTGYTYSEDFPVSAQAPQAQCSPNNEETLPLTPCGDAFIVKLNATASALLYATYLGGNSVDQGRRIAVDSAENAYVIGATDSLNFPTTANAFQPTIRCKDLIIAGPPCDVFVAKLNSMGSAFIYATYLGGNYAESAGGIAVDTLGNAYVTGSTGSTDFPTTGGALQTTCGSQSENCSSSSFVVKLNSSGTTALYATYLGGSASDGANDITLDEAGNAYVTGSTDSIDFPVTNDAFQPSCSRSPSGMCSHDAFIVKLNPTGSALVYSTYLGGKEGWDAGHGIVRNATGEIYITGTTTSSDFPTKDAFQTGLGGGICGQTRRFVPCSDAFVVKFDAAGSVLQYSSYLGGYGEDTGVSVVADKAGVAYVLGYSVFLDFPLIGPAPLGSPEGGGYFIATIDDRPPTIRAYLEYPENGPVAGIGVIHGWAFTTDAGGRVDRVDLFIDGQRVKDIPGIWLDEIPCCSERQDVRDAFPQFLAENTLNSGWGITFNWSLLEAGNHSVRVKVTSSTGEIFLTDTRTVTVVKPGDFEFLDRFDLSRATAAIENQDLVVNGVVIHDKATKQQKTINTRFRWFTSTQSLGLVQAETAMTLSTQRLEPPWTAWVASLASGLSGRSWLASAQAVSAIVPYFEDPAPEQIVSGIRIIRGWAFSEESSARISTIRLTTDAEGQGTIPCCSGRGDVAAAFPGQANALNSGWGATFNYGNLSSGPHTIAVQIEDSTGAAVALAHNVTVVRLGGFEFLDHFDLTDATARIDGQEIVLRSVKIRDKATQQEKMVTIRLQWFESAQGLGAVEASG